MKTRKQFVTMALAAILGIVAGLTACDNDKPSETATCNCGQTYGTTLHLVGEPCCEAAGCICEKNVVGQRVNGIAVTNRNGNLTDFNAAVGRIKSTLDMIEDYNSEMASAFYNGVREISIVSSGTNKNVLENGKYLITINEITAQADIETLLYDLACEISGLE